MTLPARDRSGPLGPVTVPDGETVELRDFRPTRSAGRIVLLIRSDQDVTLSIYRITSAGTESLHVAPIAITGMASSDAENRQVLDWPLIGALRLRVANASGSDAVVNVDVATIDARS